VMFEYDTAQNFKKILKVLKTFFDETHFRASPYGLHVRELDSTHTALIDMVIPKHCFLSYDVPEEEVFCISLKDLFREVFKNVYKDEHVAWKTAEKQLTVSFKGKELTRNFTVPLLDVDDEDYPLPKIDCNTVFEMKIEHLKRILLDAHDYITISVEGDTVKFESKEETKFTSEVKPQFLSKTGEPVKSTFNTEYLLALMKTLDPLTSEVKICLATDTPLKIIADLENEEKIIYFQAPYVEEDC